MAPRNDFALWAGLIRLQPDSAQTIQAQIRQAIVSAILDRQVSPSVPLPSCRVLASRLGVARGTVVLAFQQLVDQGFLVSRQRRGHFVNPEILAAPELQSPPAPAQRIDWSARRQIDARRFPTPIQHKKWVDEPYPFVYGQFDQSLFPTAEWRECTRMALAVLEIRDWAADRVDMDDPLLIEQIQARLLPRRGIFARPEEILITLGAQHGLFMLASMLVHRDMKVAVEDPGYPDARSIFGIAGGEVVPVPVDREGIIVDAIPKDVGIVFVTPSHQSPTMVTLSDKRRHELLSAAEEHDWIIVEDDYDSQLVNTNPQQALRGMDHTGRVVHLGSMSKSFAPGLRTGYMVAPAELIAELRAFRRIMLRHPPTNNQRAVALFLSLGHHDALVRRVSTAFDERRRTLLAAVACHMPQWQTYDVPGAAGLWMKGPRGTDTEHLSGEAAARGIIVSPGARFFDKPALPCPYMRLGISSIPVAQIEPGIRELAKVFRHSQAAKAQ